MKNDQLNFGLFDNIFNPVVVLNNKYEIIYSNNQFSTFSGLPPRKIKKLNKLSEIINTPDLNIHDFLKEGFEKKDVNISEEIKITFAESKTPQYTVLKFIPEGPHFIVSFNDLSVERNLFDKYKEKLEELKETHGQILQADKLATLGELTAGISHEISNPLTIALGNIEVLEMILNGPEENLLNNKKQLQDYLKNVNDSLKRINAIIENMKEYLHKSEDVKEYCSLEEVVQNSMSLVIPFFREADVKIKKYVEVQNLVGLVNKIKIEQVVINLLKNALDAILLSNTENGEVTISLKNSKDQNNILIEISDNGPGIATEHLPEIFNAFFSTKKVGEGTGLGLSISKKIIESHHGILTAENNKNGGALFRITLPLLEAVSFTQNERYLTGISKNEGKKILVIDDDVHVLNIMNTFVENAGHVFIGSTNGVEALKFLENLDIDLIITDYEMPQMNGAEFSKNARSQGLTTPIVYLTSSRHLKDFESEKDKYDVMGVILKPFTREDVEKTINMIIKGSKK